MSESSPINFVIPNWFARSSSTVFERCLLWSWSIFFSCSSWAMCVCNSLIWSTSFSELRSFSLRQDGFWSWAMEWLGYLLRGDFSLGDAAHHEKIEGIASSFKYQRPFKVTRKSVIFKCKEQILVRSVIWNAGDTSRRIFTSHSWNICRIEKYQKSETIGLMNDNIESSTFSLTASDGRQWYVIFFPSGPTR